MKIWKITSYFLLAAIMLCAGCSSSKHPQAVFPGSGQDKPVVSELSENKANNGAVWVDETGASLQALFRLGMTRGELEATIEIAGLDITEDSEPFIEAYPLTFLLEDGMVIDITWVMYEGDVVVSTVNEFVPRSTLQFLEQAMGRPLAACMNAECIMYLYQVGMQYTEVFMVAEAPYEIWSFKVAVSPEHMYPDPDNDEYDAIQAYIKGEENLPPNDTPEANHDEMAWPEGVERDPGDERSVEGRDFRSELIGLWHKSPSLGSGWSERLAFMDDNTFIFAASQMDGETRERFITGTWDVGADGRLHLSLQETLWWEGGRTIPAEGSMATTMEIVDARLVRLQHNPPEKAEVPIGNYITIEGDPHPHSICFEDWNTVWADWWWKFEGELDWETFMEDYSLAEAEAK